MLAILISTEARKIQYSGGLESFWQTMQLLIVSSTNYAIFDNLEMFYQDGYDNSMHFQQDDIVNKREWHNRGVCLFIYNTLELNTSANHHVDHFKHMGDDIFV